MTRITKEIFNKKLTEYEEKQAEIEVELSRHTYADKNFYLNAGMLLSLVKRAVSVFDGSEPETKRRFSNFLLQNCELQEKKLEFSLRNPFDRILATRNKLIVLCILKIVRTHFAACGGEEARLEARLRRADDNFKFFLGGKL